MDARISRIVLRAALFLGTACSLGASYRTQNFLVSAPSQQLAESIGNAAEQYRHDLAVTWLGHELPGWESPCPITAQVSDQLGAGGATSFVFEHGQVGGWQMNIQGSALRIIDSVLPHEVTHTIFATHFREPLPRWADEGACTTVEAPSERARNQQMLITFLTTGRGIAMTRLFSMKDYPADILPLYAQGHSVARYLIEQGGRRKFVEFVGDGLQDENWPRAMKKFYGDDSLAGLQNRWLDWVRQGSPRLNTLPDGPSAPTQLVSNHGPRPRPTPNLIYHQASGNNDAATYATPLVSLKRGQQSSPPERVASNAAGWHATGATSAPAPVNDRPPPEPAAQAYQAVRPQPPQPTTETVIEP